MSTMWAFMASWFTTSSLFVFVNLTILTIFLTSRFTSHRKPHQQEQHQQLVRVPSVLERVSSFNFSFYKFDQPNNPEPPMLSEYPTLQHSEPEHVSPDPPTQIARTPSLLERLKSVSVLYRSDSATPEPETDPDESEGHINLDPPTQIARTPSLVEQLKYISVLYRSDSATPEPETDTDGSEKHVSPDPPTQIARTPSLLERLWSISSLYRSDSATPEPETDTDESEDEISDPGHEHLVRRSRSDRVGGVVVKPGEKMKKSASEKSTLEKKRETALLGYDEEVDAKADDFINRFKQQLRLQRLNSLLSSRGK
ncbi:pathogen-associated molecular patterns-induced protein A70 [Quercus suber]|uniref:DUF4408 domain-containing protein n=1 Tax=Quercus suber TaxID=58331 RepID=A0AAW0MBF2_QUESU|nr:uncharacterized protein LOC112037934 [Quercus suber]POE92966.1 hypothetical protein CFP56_48112 [Quercus suber]